MTDKADPLVVQGKTERGTDVLLDVRRMCAESTVIHATVAKAIERLLEEGFAATNVADIGIILKGGDGIDSAQVIVINDDELDFESYLVDFEYGSEAD